MKKRCLYPVILAAFSLLVTSCDEGKEIVRDREEYNIGTEFSNNSEPPKVTQSVESTTEGNILELRFHGGIYQVENWTLYKSLADAGIAEGEWAETGIDLECDTIADILMVTMTMTNTPDIFGEIEEEIYLNNFLPVTKSAIDSAYLPEPEPETVNRIHLEYGKEAMYLNIGQFGTNSYFAVDTPVQGDSMNYKIGFVLTEDECIAAKEGELYLWYSMDEAQSVEELQLLYLSLDLFQE